MSNSEKERNINLAQNSTQAWQKMVEAGQLSLYMSLRHEEVEELKKSEGEIGKNEYIVAYLRTIEEMCQKEKK